MEQEQRLHTDWADDWRRDFGGPPPSPPPPPRADGPDLAPLLALLDLLRRGVPRELQAQFNSLLREALLTLRALIDWYIERLDRAGRPPEVEDIPIE